MGEVVLLDEAKQRGYQLVAVSVADATELANLRPVVRGLVLSGQTRLHMKKESEPRKRRIASAIVAAGSAAVVYDAGRSRRLEPALAVPDAIAWCWAKGGDWRRRIAPVVSGVRLV